MNLLHPNAKSIAQKYIGADAALEELGYGLEGVVYATLSRMTAIKVHSHRHWFEQELTVYERLRQHRVTEVQGFSVPQLVASDRALTIIEMSIVKPPFLLDFAQTRLDEEPDFPEGIDEWWERVRERFDDEQFPIVQSVFWELVQRYGIYYWDLKPGNIEFAGAVGD